MVRKAEKNITITWWDGKTECEGGSKDGGRKGERKE